MTFIEGLRAKPFKNKELSNPILVLKKNNLKQINCNNNNHVIRIDEDEEKEELYVHSTLSEEELAIIGNEFYLNFLENPKKVDLTYIFLSKDHKAIVYLYDMKKTFAGIDVILHLIAQWKSSIEEAEYCVKKLGGYKLSGIRIGVITENDDEERRKKELEPILYPSDIPKQFSSFLSAKHLADNSNNLAKAKILKGFLNGKVTICGCTYEYDIRKFVEKKHEMYFDSGKLKEENIYNSQK